LKTIPFTAAHTYISHIGECPLGVGERRKTERIEVGEYILLLCRLFNLTASITV